MCRCTVGNLAETAQENQIHKTALIVVGRILDGEYQRSELYHPAFSTEFREASCRREDVPDIRDRESKGKEQQDV